MVGDYSDFKFTVTAESLPLMVLPLVDYIRESEPEFIVACDTGARPVGVAIELIYDRLFGPLPTVDGRIHYRLISKSRPQETVKEHLRPLAGYMARLSSNPRLLVVDDVIGNGTTKSLVDKLFSELSGGTASITFAALVGERADVCGYPFPCALEWTDAPDLIGVRYVNMEPRDVRGPDHESFRERIALGIDALLDESRL